MLFEDQLSLVSSSKTILEETVSSILSLEFFQHYLHGITVIWNLIVSSVILSALLFFTCPLQVYYDLILALFEIRSSHSSISLSFNTYAFRFSDCIVSSSWSLLPLSILSTQALSTQPYQHHFPDSSASQTHLASITQCLQFPYFVCLLVSLKMKIVCVHVYLLVLFYSLRKKSRFWANLPRSYQKFYQQLFRKPIPRPLSQEPLYQITATPINQFLFWCQGMFNFKGSSMLFSSFVCCFSRTLCSLSVPGKQEQTELHAVLRTEIMGKSTCLDSLQWLLSVTPFSDLLGLSILLQLVEFHSF